MDKTYLEYKTELEAQYGKCEYDYDRKPLNTSAQLLAKFKGQMLLEARQAKAKVSESKSIVTPVMADLVNENKEKYKSVQVPEITLLDKELSGFQGVEKDIVKAYFVNRELKPSTLASQFNKSYQFVAGLLKSKPVQLLELKYFREDAHRLTQLGVIKGLKAGDSRLILEAAQHLNVLGSKIEESEFKSDDIAVDEFTQSVLKTVADWLADGSTIDLVLKAKDVTKL